MLRWLRSTIWSIANRAHRNVAAVRSANPTVVGSVAVVLGLVRTFDGHAEVLRLVLRKIGQFDPEMTEVQPRNFFIEMLRQDVDLLLVFVVVLVELELRDDLVRERGGHHEARVPGRAT